MFKKYTEASSRSCAPFWWIVAEILGITSIIIILVILFQYHPGTWTWPDDAFNYHPFFLSLGFVFINGNGALFFRMLYCFPKWPTVTIIHAVNQTLGFIFMVTGLCAAFLYDKLEGKIEGTVHDWVGFATVIMYTIQLVLGCVYLFPDCVPQYQRKWLLPLHRAFGLAILWMSTAAAMLGLPELVEHADIEDPEDEVVLNYLNGVFSLAVGLYSSIITLLVLGQKFAVLRLRDTATREELLPLKPGPK